MKWVKVAIGAVIAIISMGIIATSVYDMTQERVVLGERIDIITGEISAVADGINEGYRFFNTADFNHVFINDTVVVDKIENGVIFLEYNGVNGSFTVKLTSWRLSSGTVSVVSINDNSVEYIDYIRFINTFDEVRNGYGNYFGDTNQMNDFNSVFGFEYEIGDTLTLYDNGVTILPPQLSGISATLLLLTPLVFAGGVLAYLLNKQNY